MVKALLFDFDGVIVNTEPLHYQAFQQVLDPLGLGFTWNEYHEHYIGYDDRDALRERFRHAEQELTSTRFAELMEAKAKAFADLAQGDGCKPYPGVVELILSAGDAVPLAICSGARRCDIDPVLATIKLADSFDLIVSADDVQASKPNPESYVTAVERLAREFPLNGITASTCVAIEDTPAGVRAARKAHCQVLAVTNTYPPDKLAEAHVAVRTLEGLTLDAIRGIFG